MNDIIKDLYEVILARRANPTEGSYTCYLFDKGLDKILKKVGEECEVEDVAAELEKRRQKSGNLKKFHQVDKNS